MVIVGAFIVSTAIFLGLTRLSETVISDYVRNTHFTERETIRLIDSLRDFVTENAIGSKNLSRVHEWDKREKYVRLIVFQGRKAVYDSDTPGSAPVDFEALAGVAYAPNCSITFSDFEAPVHLEFFLEYRFYELATVFQLIVSFIAFITIVVFFVGRHLSYINRIAFGIGILEGGNLEYEIPVRGNDELATLASSLNEMRKAFIKKGERGEGMTKTGKENLSAISHDLRTPLTTLILFIEIIKTKKNLADEERDHYIQKLSVIANRIKLLSENLEDFTSEKYRYSVTLDDPRSLTAILDEVLAEPLVFLRERDFRVVRKTDIGDGRIRVNSHFVYRIIDNIVSNIDRYASHDHPITIAAVGNRDTVTLTFENRIAVGGEPISSSKLGISLIKEMMHKMGGSCETSVHADRFAISLAFPLVPESDSKKAFPKTPS